MIFVMGEPMLLVYLFTKWLHHLTIVGSPEL